MICWTNSGMLSRGVTPPDSIWSGKSTMIMRRANCGMVRAKVARKMPNDVARDDVERRGRRGGERPRPVDRDRKHSLDDEDHAERGEATSTTNPIDQILLVIIWNGVTGMTNKCSTVPRSRSRMSAAPVSRTESMVIWSISATTAPNERRLRLGL